MLNVPRYGSFIARPAEKDDNLVTTYVRYAHKAIWQASQAAGEVLSCDTDVSRPGEGRIPLLINNPFVGVRCGGRLPWLQLISER